MDISAALAADLASLSGLLDEADADLEGELRALGAELSAAVSSYVAMTMTIYLHGHQVSFSVSDSDGDGETAASSLLIPLPTDAGAQSGRALVLFASRQGAFVDLAADLGYALGIGVSELVLDGHLDSRPVSTGTDGLDELTIVSQAVGVLLARGHSQAGARVELKRRADLAGVSTRLAAEQIVAGVNR